MMVFGGAGLDAVMIRSPVWEASRRERGGLGWALARLILEAVSSHLANPPTNSGVLQNSRCAVMISEKKSDSFTRTLSSQRLSVCVLFLNLASGDNAAPFLFEEDD